MKTFLTTLAALTICFSLTAQKMNSKNLEDRIAEMENKTALRELVDKFSIMADKKLGKEQAFLFTENATVETYIDNQLVTKLAGRDQIGNTFDSFLKSLETVYHINGQHAVTINGNKATGVLYCSVALIGNQNGKKYKTLMLVQYDDEYAQENNLWLIAKRVSHFVYQERTEVNQ